MNEDANEREWALLNAHIADLRRQARWEPWKALAAILATVSAVVATVIALSDSHEP